MSQTRISKAIRRNVLTVLKAAVLSGLMFFRASNPNFLERNMGVSSRYLHAVIFFLTALLILDLAKLVIIHVYRRRRKLRSSDNDNFVLGIEEISNLILVGMVVLSCLIALDIQLRDAFTTISIVAAAIAILSKDYVSNAINGMIIMFGDQFSLGDVISVNEYKGRILDITLLNIHLLNDDDDLIYIPNSLVLSTSVVNFTKRPIKKISIEFEIDFKTLHDVGELEQFLIRSLHGYESSVLAESYNLKVVDLKKDHAILKFQYMLRNNDRELERDIRRLTIRQVVHYIEEKLSGKLIGSI